MGFLSLYLFPFLCKDAVTDNDESELARRPGHLCVSEVPYSEFIPLPAGAHASLRPELYLLPYQSGELPS
jgi:hypothetical protein